ncbi:MAG: tRNA (adenosine(37)-N6)-threonylcarbamoyltransferase complex dimerization subunit type 1 TsaB, partial [Actinobacteria bacterium]|nr:tRNA (adenosine(37)-N6)-threonylcarbamoyltransferase complex dimerization subunit type 1 TsaB [Actinomycetota bacterium]
MVVIVLGIESATESVGVALAASDGVLASVEVARGRRHAESIVPDIELSEVGAIAVDVGPGLFTGMRVGIATAKSLAMALNIPMVPMTSLEVLAAAEATTDDIIVPVVDARKSEVFWAMYRRTHQGLELLHQPTVGSVDDLVSDLMARDQSSVCVGDGAHRYGDDITEGLPFVLSNPAGSTNYQATGVAYDIAINGLPFFLAASDDSPYRRVTAQYRKQQYDQTREAGEQSLTGWWFRSQSSFHLGQGIKYFEPAQDESLRFQYTESKGL